MDNIQTCLNRGSDGRGGGDGQEEREASLDAWALCQSLRYTQGQRDG